LGIVEQLRSKKKKFKGEWGFGSPTEHQRGEFIEKRKNLGKKMKKSKVWEFPAD